MNVNSTTEGHWNEVVAFELSDEQQMLLKSNNATDNKAKAELVTMLQDGRLKAISDESIIAELNAEYGNLKPTLSESDTYQLISVDMSLNEDNKVISSILNCRINGEHKQVRG